MGSGGGVSGQLRPSPDAPRPNGPWRDDVLREPEHGHMVPDPADADKLRYHLRAWDWLAMVIEKAVKAVKESSWAAKIVAALLTVLVGQVSLMMWMMVDLNRETGVHQANLANHLEGHSNNLASHVQGHPDIAINDELAEIHDTMRLIADRLRNVEIVQGSQPNGAR